MFKIEEESKNMKSESEGAGDRIKDRTQELTGQAQGRCTSGRSGRRSPDVRTGGPPPNAGSGGQSQLPGLSDPCEQGHEDA